MHWQFSFAGRYGAVAVLNATSQEFKSTLAPFLNASEIEENPTKNNTNFIDCFPSTQGTNLAEIPAKEIIIVVLMLGLWVYSIILTRKAWYRILKEWAAFINKHPIYVILPI